MYSCTSVTSTSWIAGQRLGGLQKQLRRKVPPDAGSRENTSLLRRKVPPGVGQSHEEVNASVANVARDAKDS